MVSYWVGVASREHVSAAVHGGFCQLSHGKDAPVRRLDRGDFLIFYSPHGRMGERTPLQAFTASAKSQTMHLSKSSNPRTSIRSVAGRDISKQERRPSKIS